MVTEVRHKGNTYYLVDKPQKRQTKGWWVSKWTTELHAWFDPSNMWRVENWTEAWENSVAQGLLCVCLASEVDGPEEENEFGIVSP